MTAFEHFLCFSIVLEVVVSGKSGSVAPNIPSLISFQIRDLDIFNEDNPFFLFWICTFRLQA